MADGAGAGQRWVAMTVRGPHKENIAKLWIENAGFESELPMETRYRRRRGGNRERFKFQRIAMRGYLFVAVPPAMRPGELIANVRDKVALLGRPVGMGGKPIVIREGWRAALNWSLLDPDYVEHDPYVVGAPVVLNEEAGVWSGYRGLIDSVTEREVIVLVESLHRALEVRATREQISVAA